MQQFGTRFTDAAIRRIHCRPTAAGHPHAVDTVAGAASNKKPPTGNAEARLAGAIGIDRDREKQNNEAPA